jgi:hypothetical protein
MLILEIAVILSKVALICFSADIIISESSKYPLPTLSLYIDLCSKFTASIISLVSSLPGGKVLLGITTMLAANDIGLLSYVEKKTSIILDQVNISIYLESLVNYKDIFFQEDFSLENVYAGELDPDNIL